MKAFLNRVQGALYLFLSAFTALAVPVTFQVDLGPRINTGEFNPEGDQIEVRGSFNNWSGGVPLARTNSASTVYTGTTNITGTAGSTVEFKFVQVSNGTEMWETTPNRPFPLPAVATNLPVSYFNNVWEGAPVPVKFQVNMGTQQAAGAFDPAAGDFVEVRGSFNNWTSGFVLEPSAANPTVYENTAEVADAPGARVEYKFVINRAANGQVVWENDPNRAFTQVAETQSLPVAYFNNVTGVPVKALVKFQVDLGVQIAAGRFDTNSQEVYIRGNKVGWNAPPEGLQLLPDATRPGIYTNTWKTESLITGDRIEYKATIWTPDTQTTTWEDGGNKSLVFEGSEPKDANGYLQATVSPFYFNGVAPGDLLNGDTTVTFRVDMRNARTTDGTAFDPAVNAVTLNGSFLENGWQPWGSLDKELFDDGESGGDTNANDGIYTLTLTIPRGTPARLEYKYGINGADNEAASGSNHVRYVRANGSYVLPVDSFGTMTQESATEDIGRLTAARAAQGKIRLSWQAQPGVRLQRLDRIVGGSATEVPVSEGENTIEVPASGSMGFFRLLRP